MSFVANSEKYFSRAMELMFGALEKGENLNCSFEAEQTLFVRFNANKVRQNTSVKQLNLTFTFHRDGRSVERSKTVSGFLGSDQAGLLEILAECRQEAAALPVDSFQVEMKNNGESHQVFTGRLPSIGELVESVAKVAEGSDLAGLYCGGTVISANRNSLGQNHWFANETFFFDYSLYDGARAAKGGLAGSDWKDSDWESNFERTKSQLVLLGKPLQTIKPGKYRTYLAPKAVAELLETISWGGLSGGALKQGRSPFKKFAEGEASLAPAITLRENFGLGFAPRFNSLGEVAPESLDIISGGKLKQMLISSKSAKEFGLTANGAGESEVPRSLDLQPGALAEKDALKSLGTGLYLSNLHYLNWSDPVSARITGMTRYACFWVENGAIIGPIKDMRFDESVYEALGSKLEALTKETEISPATSTYGARTVGGSRTPGALISEFSFTL